MTSSRRDAFDNPYVPPHSASETPTRTLQADLSWVRLIFYFHVVAIVLCAILVSHDTRQLQLPDLARIFLPIVALPLFVSWMLFPLAMMVAASRLQNRTTVFRLAVIGGDLLLSIFQIWVLSPMVQ